MDRAAPLVAITRPAAQAAGLVRLLEAEGIATLVAPAIRRVAPASWGPLDEGIRGVEAGRYLGVLFTSPAAVEAYALRSALLRGEAPFESKLVEGDPAPAFGAAPPPLPELAGRIVGAVGRGTAAVLARHGIARCVLSRDGTGGGLAEALRAELGERLAGARFLQPRAAAGREELATGLRACGAAVDVVDAYRTEPAGAAELAELARRADRLGAVIYASPSAVEAVFAAAPAVRTVPAVAIGATTGAALVQAGARAIFEADHPDDEGLLAATLRALGRTTT